MQDLRVVDGGAGEELLAHAGQPIDGAVKDRRGQRNLAVVLDAAHDLAPGLRLARTEAGLRRARRLCGLAGRRLVGRPPAPLGRRLVGLVPPARRLVGRSLALGRLPLGRLEILEKKMICE